MRFIIFVLLFVSSSIAAAASTGGSDGINIPVRLAINAGYFAGSLSFDPDYKNDSIRGFGGGADFNVPIGKGMIGMNGFLVFGQNSGNVTTRSLLLLGAYLGYIGNQYDVFLGPAAGLTTITTSNTDAAPNQKVSESVTLGCGMGGVRKYWGKVLTVGLGVTGFYCFSGHYDKEVTNAARVSTVTVEQKNASIAGGMLYLMLGWGDTRKLL